jgi:hypothetical protein
MTKQFLPTYLYIKTHNITGLKYFGKTIGDPHKYRGSGTHWLAHIKKYGYNVTTEILGYYTDKDSCMEAALKFSVDNDIIKAVNENNKKLWANQIIENGLDGGNTNRTNYKPHTEESKIKMSNSHKGQIAWNKGILGSVPGNTKTRTEETKQKLREANLGKTQTKETIEKRRKSLLGHIVTEETKKKISEKHKGKIISEETKQKMRGKVMSAEQKQHLREINLGKKQSDETKLKLSGKVVAVNKAGELKRIDKAYYYSQTGPKVDWEWVSHKSNEAKMRRG